MQEMEIVVHQNPSVNLPAVSLVHAYKALTDNKPVDFL